MFAFLLPCLEIFAVAVAAGAVVADDADKSLVLVLELSPSTPSSMLIVALYLVLNIVFQNDSVYIVHSISSDTEHCT